MIFIKVRRSRTPILFSSKGGNSARDETGGDRVRHDRALRNRQKGTMAGMLGCSLCLHPCLDHDRPGRSRWRVAAMRFVNNAGRSTGERRMGRERKLRGPVRVRITDRRLGFTCVKAVGDATTRCRAFVPPPMAQELDRSRFVHCVGVELTTSPGAVSLSRVDEWIGASLPCALYPPEQTTTAQIDLELGRACITPGEQCIAIARLSALGRRRVQGIVQKAVKAFLDADPKTYLEDGT